MLALVSRGGATMQSVTKPEPGRHLADKRSPSTNSKVAQFLRLDRAPREVFHSSRPASTARVERFLRIERGETA
jgi:hypothetical protein